MKLALKIMLGVHGVLIIFLLHQTFDLISLLNDDSFQDALTPAELESPETQLIPKIIHQTYKTLEIPDIWKAGQQACIDLHPDYDYKLWTDASAREFIASHYLWFLETWDKYPYPIERADAIRYFVLDHYGGIYIDLDDGCYRNLDPLLSLRAFVRKTNPTGISNDVLGSVPGHPFFKMAIANLKQYQCNWLFPYITIMFSTGPLFLSVIWRRYKRWGVPISDRVRILMMDEYKGHSKSFFTISQGSSWHLNDASFIKFMGRHLVWAVIGGFVIALLIILIEYLIYLCFSLATFKKLMRMIGSSIMDGCQWLFELVGLPPCFESAVESPQLDVYTGQRSNLVQMVRDHLFSEKRRSRKDSNLEWNRSLLDNSSETELESRLYPVSIKLLPYLADSDDNDQNTLVSDVSTLV